MASLAEPRPAELPLPGGRRNATVRLHPILTGEMLSPEAWLHRAEGRLAGAKAFGIRVPRDQWVRIPAPAFLVEHPGAGPLVIDTGFHSSVAVEPRQSLGRLGPRLFREPKMEASQALAAQLRARGIDRVAAVLMTHLHYDHASAMAEFSDSTFLFSLREWQAATDQGELHGYVRRQFDHAFDYRTLDFEHSDSDSFASFGRRFDVFGDGSVQAVYTPGHTHGHVSYVLRLSRREALVAGDAIYTMRTLRESHLPHRMEDEHVFRRSLGEIQIYARETPDAVIIPGHDMKAWEALEPVYD